MKFYGMNKPKHMLELTQSIKQTFEPISQTSIGSLSPQQSVFLSF
jgi:hypothetical protein